MFTNKNRLLSLALGTLYHVTPLKRESADIPSNVWYVVSQAGKILFKGPYENATRYLNNLRQNFPAIKADIYNTQGLTPSQYEVSSVEKFKKIVNWDPTGGKLNAILSWPGKAPE